MPTIVLFVCEIVETNPSILHMWGKQASWHQAICAQPFYLLFWDKLPRLALKSHSTVLPWICNPLISASQVAGRIMPMPPVLALTPLYYWYHYCVHYSRWVIQAELLSELPHCCQLVISELGQSLATNIWTGYCCAQASQAMPESQSEGRPAGNIILTCVTFVYVVFA